MVIKILGPGCVNCDRLAQRVRQTVMQMGMEATIVKARNPDEWLRYGLLFTPGLVVNEKLVCGGRVPAPEEISTWLANAAMAEQGSSTA